MTKKFSFVSHFNWKILLLRILVNSLALILVGGLIPNIFFVDRTLQSVLLAAILLGVLNAFIKPLLLFLTAQLFFATYGLLVIVINTMLLYLLHWIMPERFAVSGIIWPLVGGLLLGLVSTALENLLGLTPPIVPEAEAEIKQKIKEQSVSPLQSLAGMPSATVGHDIETQSVEEVQAARAALDAINSSLPTPAEMPPPLEEAEPPAEPAPPEPPPAASAGPPPIKTETLPAESNSTGGQA
jgi:putative membrane protein